MSLLAHLSIVAAKTGLQKELYTVKDEALSQGCYMKMSSTYMTQHMCVTL